MKSRHFLIVIASLFFMLLSGNALADNNAEKLLQKGMEVFKTGNYKLAEELFLNALEMEESDVLWLNLGRTYMHQNRCVDAAKAYHHVELKTAQGVVIDKYTEYQQDLAQWCTCEVHFACTNANAKVFIDNTELENACNEAVHLTPGFHVFREENAGDILISHTELPNDGNFTLIDFKATRAEQTAEAANAARIAFPTNTSTASADNNEEAFAQNEYLEADGSYEQANAAEPANEQTNVVEPADKEHLVQQQVTQNINTAPTAPYSYHAPVEQPVARYDWQAESKKMRGAGWGLFGGGLALQVIGIGVSIRGEVADNNEMASVGLGMAVIGGLSTTTGIILLIVEAIRFNPYRRGWISGYDFEWKPDLIVSPEFNGAGVSFRF